MTTAKNTGAGRKVPAPVKYTRHSITDAKAGDQIWQADEWWTIADIRIIRDTVLIFWGKPGSTMTRPISHFGEFAVRREVPAETAPLYLPTSELRPGDVVLNHGMRLLIIDDAHTYPGGATNITWDDTVYVWPARVTNWTEVNGDPYIRYHATHGTGSTADPRWDIQGNELAHWHVDREVREGDAK